MKRLALALIATLWSQPASAGGGEPAADGTAAEAATDGTADGSTDGATDDATDGATDGSVDTGTGPRPPEDEGCSCRVASAPIPPSWPAWLLGLSLALLRRQRKP